MSAQEDLKLSPTLMLPGVKDSRKQLLLPNLPKSTHNLIDA